MDSNIRHDNLVSDLINFPSLRLALSFLKMLFLNHGAQHKDTEQHCLACGHQGLTAYVKASMSGFGVSEAALNIIFYRCERCQSINEFSSSQGFYAVDEDDSFANFYLDVGAGIEEMIDPIARFASFEASKPPQDLAWSFLELGCGFGFVVDYASKVLGWQAHGIEPGGYGRIGSAALGVNIERQLLGQGSQFDGGRYDCIYASEVIEHVTNPDAFFKTCREHLSDRGVLILTTPVAEYISPQNQREEVYANLFPGEHKIIFSAAGLRSSLARAGFQHVELEKRRSSNWVVIASFDRNYEGIYSRADLSDLSNEQYATYLQKILKSGSTSASMQQQRVKLAMCFRLVKHFVNKGKYDEALKILVEWYRAIAILADPECSHSAIHDCPPADRDSLLCSLLNLCLIGLTRERIEVEHFHRPYPTSGAAFLKTLGFFVTIIAHNTEVKDQGRVLPIVATFLESLIGYASYVKRSQTPFYHLELISLIGPATTCLLLARKKLELSVFMSDYLWLNEASFAQSYPVSYEEIMALISTQSGQHSPENQALGCVGQAQGIKARLKGLRNLFRTFVSERSGNRS